jgi:SAM-dependent methyltransferase
MLVVRHFQSFASRTSVPTRAFFRNWLLAFLTPRPFVGLFYLPRYWRDWRRFQALRQQPLAWRDAHPCLGDWVKETPFDAHYFFQGAWLARRLAAAKPALHVDIGSSALMMSVASAATETAFIDYRPLRSRLPGLHSVAGDITCLPLRSGSLRSLSSLHVIEHIGLGRYGDPLDPQGSAKAGAELARVVAPGGRLYLSVPVGRERVCFNAHRVFHPESVVGMLAPLKLERFALVDDHGGYHEDANTAGARALDYGCGLFEFVKRA